jgi:hypothetical protein
MFALGVAVMATDGATTEDWLALAAFLVLSVVLIPTAWWRLRRLKRRRPGTD